MKKVSLFIKKIILSILIGASMMSVVTVNASAPSSIKMASKSSMYYFSGSTAYISGYKFYQKKLSDGTLGYCASTINSKVPGGLTLYLKGKADAGLTYIINNGYPSKSFTGNSKKDYYITQSAIWEYFDRTRGQNNWKSTNFSGASNGSMKYYVDVLATGAVNALNNSGKTSPTINANVSSTKLTLSGSYYVSELVTASVANSNGKYTVSLTSAPTGTVIKSENGTVKTTFNSGEKFRVYVPSNTSFAKIGVRITTSKTVYEVYEYTSGDSKYQDIITTVQYPTTVSKTYDLNFTYEKTKLSISKQDITTKKELPGATLVLKNASGKVMDTWVSTNQPHYIEGLPVGKYILTETIAPEGYVLSNETITFDLTNNGVVKTVVMYNQMNEITKIKVSKQDITTKKELPGATLVVKDANGKVVDTWVSTNEPHYVENLKVGKYTLTETIAPNGYVLSNETIEFEVKRDGSIKTVVMYNQMNEITKIKVSKQDITTKKELPGATLVVKDANGKVVDTWVSTNEPHYVENLKVGKYTLTETIAPEGYVLSNETIEFEVKRDGSIKTVVMYNQMNEITKIKVSKQDITTKEELPGATLVVKDANGKVVDTWVSTNEPHYVENLKVGKYTLTETIAPEGYVLSNETIEFEVKNDGSIKTVVMYNEKIPTTTKVKISKQDITTKKELPGATLVIKDASGNEIATWVSTNEPHYIEGLKEGTYTLTETIAPKGYELSSETITFEVKNDGSIKTVIMYNTPYVEVPSTALNASSFAIILGVILSLFGMGMVFKNVKGEE